MSLDILNRTRDFSGAASMEEDRAPIDFPLLFIFLAIVGFGLVSLFSASLPKVDDHIGSSFHFLQRQLIALVIGTIGMVFVMQLPNYAMRFLARWGVSFCIVLLILVFIPGLGYEAGGAKRWLFPGSFHYQPAELAKLTFILYVADFVQRRPAVFRGDFIQQWPLLTLFVVVALLLAKQPDNGTIMVIFSVVVMMMIIAGMKVKVWLPIVVLAVIGGVILYFTTPYIQSRFDAFLNPLKDPRGKSWQLINALIALGRGGWTGVGLGESVQKTGYLPEAHNDFIFAVIGEELGFFGTAMTISLFALLVMRLFMLAKHAAMRGDLFGAMLIYGVALWITFQSMVHFTVNTGWFPTKGLTLPFVSYGSSSLMTMILALGFVFNVQRQKREIMY